MSRYAEDLKRIVGIDKVNKALEDLANKSAISSRRGEAFYNASGTLSAQTGNAGSSANPLAVANSNPGNMYKSSQNDEDAQEALADKKNIVNAGNLAGDLLSGFSNGFTLPDAGIIGIDDLLAAANGEIDRIGLAGFDNYNHPILGINELTECVSGLDVSLRFDGSYIPPVNWTHIDDPIYIADELWLENYVWYFPNHFVAGMFKYIVSPNDDTRLTFNIALSRGAANGSGPGTLFGPDGFGNYYLWNSIGPSVTGGSPGDYSVFMIQADSLGVPIGPEFETFRMRLSACPIGDDSENLCGLTDAPNTLDWTEDGTFELALLDGVYRAHELDPDAPDEYKEGMSKLVLCSDANDVGMEPAIGGGQLIYRTDGAGAVEGVVTILNADGTIKGFTDSVGMDSYKLNA